MARTRMTEQEFRDSLTDEGSGESAEFQPTAEEWDDFTYRIHYFPADVTLLEDVERLDNTLSHIEDQSVPANRLYHLALAPNLYAPTLSNLGVNGLGQENGCWRRVVLEKPFGTDLESAQYLDSVLHSAFNEEQVYRNDHYIGKGTVQNLLVFRFANTIFEPVWSRNYIDNVQITVSETVSVSDRADYYDQAGVLRDMFQNHLL